MSEIKNLENSLNKSKMATLDELYKLSTKLSDAKDKAGQVCYLLFSSFNSLFNISLYYRSGVAVIARLNDWVRIKTRSGRRRTSPTETARPGHKLG